MTLRPGRRAPATRAHRPSALRPGFRPTPAGRRTRSVRRASAGLTPTRAAALLALLVAIAGIYGAASSSAFAVRRTQVSGATWTPDQAILAALAVPPGQNVFLIDTTELARRLAAIPAIRSASVAVALPDEVRVAVDERTPLLVWQVGERGYLVDETGLVIADARTAPPDAPALPVIDDGRAASAEIGIGSTIAPVDLDAALRLGALKPADMGSAASRLAIRVDDDQGYVVRAEPDGWSAVFGFYTPTLRTTALIPGQVRLLRSLIADREPSVLRVILADDRSGTYVPRPGASAGASPSP